MSKIEKSEGEQQLMTLVDVAKYLQIAPRTAYGWVNAGKLPGFKVGNTWRFDRSDVQKWVQERKDQAERKGS